MDAMYESNYYFNKVILVHSLATSLCQSGF